MVHRYKGMAQSNAASTSRTITPQATGFSQIHARGGGEGGGQAMSVLLSWHEKVPVCSFLYCHPPTDNQSCAISGAVQSRLLTTAQLVEIAGPGSIVRVMTDRRTV
jgi:actin related protein 2/3 complex subunit 5